MFRARRCAAFRTGNGNDLTASGALHEIAQISCDCVRRVAFVSGSELVRRAKSEKPRRGNVEASKLVGPSKSEAVPNENRIDASRQV